MRFLIHTESLDVINVLAPLDVSFIFTEPLFSTRHPKIQTKEDFLRFLTESLSLTSSIYVEINGYQEESSLGELRLWVKELSALPVKGFYFADPAILMILNDLGYKGEKIYAPETILTNLSDVRTLLTVVDRVVLARELTLDEITAITSNCQGKVEIFGLGHWLMSVSKRPQVRNYLYAIGRDENILNRTDIRLRELKRPMFYPILEEVSATSTFSSDILFPLEEMDLIKQASCAGIHCDQLFISDADFSALVKALIDPTVKTKLDHLPLSKGYFYRKTNLTKEEGR